MTRVTATSFRRAMFAALFAGVMGETHAAHADTRDQCNAAAEDAQRLRNDDKLVEMRARLAACVRPECPAIVRNDCNKWLADLDSVTPSIVIRAVDQAGVDIVQVNVSMDGTLLATTLDGKAIAVNPGRHVFRFARTGAAPVEQQVLIREGEQHRILSITLASAPSSSSPVETDPTPVKTSHRSLVLPIVLLAAGAAGLGVASYFWASGTSQRSDLLATCYGHCMQSDIDAAHTKLVVGDVVGAASVAVAALGVAVLVWGGGRSSSSTTGLLTATPTTRGASVGLRLTF